MNENVRVTEDRECSSNIWQERETGVKDRKVVFKIIAEKFSQVQEDPLSSTLRHFIVKLQNIKERENPKGHRGIKQITFNRTTIRLLSKFP